MEKPDYKDYEHSSSRDLICDPYFQQWVIDPQGDKAAFWHEFLLRYPGAQEKVQQAKAMQDKMAVLQEKMGLTTVEGTSGGGLVKVTMTCKGQCQSITLDSSILVASEKDMAEDLIKAAINDAKSKADAKMADETQKMMAELGLPPGALGGNGGLPF